TFAIISCGGTITMELGAKGALEPKKTINEILKEINVNLSSNQFTIPENKRIELFKLDSADLNPSHWQKLIQKIEELQTDCDGILIFHGTDTMSYSATAVGLTLAQKLTVPIIFTGAQSPLGEAGSDGKTNIERAFLVLQKAAQDKVTECMIFFGHEAYRAVNSRKKSESDFQAFESPSVKPLYMVGGLGVKSFRLSRNSQNIKSKKTLDFKLKNDFASGVVVLPIIPGLEADILLKLAQNEKTKAIILISLGAGNVPALEGEFNLIPIVAHITHQLKKPLIVASPFVGGSTNMDVYLPGLLAKEAGAINAGKMTTEATVVKTRLLLAQPTIINDPDKFQKALTYDLAGETGV
ncbi:MAG TPA: asparaginase domain-containing protein, partial [Patescibacteria group bacterium]